MSTNEQIFENIDRLCSFVCNRKTYEYEQKLIGAAGSGLYDAAIIYAWNMFMLFVYEKVWQIREIERIEGTPCMTDKIFLELTKNKPDDFFSGNLFSLNKLHENKQGDDAIIGKLKEVYKGVDQQIFREAQHILQKRNTASHVNSIQLQKSTLAYVLEELIKIVEAIQADHQKALERLFQNIENGGAWHISEQDLTEINLLFDASPKDEIKHIYITNLLSKQDFSEESVRGIKENAIDYFLQSKSFDAAFSNGERILNNLLNFLDKDDIKKILAGVFDRRGHEYNQVLSAGGMEDIFWKMYEFSRNTFPELKNDWIVFAQELKNKNHSENFSKLIESIGLDD